MHSSRLLVNCCVTVVMSRCSGIGYAYVRICMYAFGFSICITTTATPPSCPLLSPTDETRFRYLYSVDCCVAVKRFQQMVFVILSKYHVISPMERGILEASISISKSGKYNDASLYLYDLPSLYLRSTRHAFMGMRADDLMVGERCSQVVVVIIDSQSRDPSSSPHR